jgi:predicted PurR-regulated permease PerM
MSRERDRLGVLAFYAGAVLLAFLVYQLFRPFLVPLAWAGVLAVCFYPTHARLERRVPRAPAALLSTASVAILVIVPLMIVGSAFVSQASRLLEEVPGIMSGMPAFASRALHGALRYVPGGQSFDPATLLDESARRMAAFLSVRAAAAVQNVVGFVVDLVITIFALFFLFRDAPILMSAIRRVIPLPADVRERLIEQTRALVTASVTSSLIVATVQGVLGGLAFWALGLAAPVVWGVVITVLCLLPFGAWIVWGPAAIWLVATGSVGRGLVLGAIGDAVVSAVDNVLRPILLSEQTEMNGLLLFIALLGGVIAFGTVGLVLGPVLMATGVALFEAFTTDGDPPAPA